MDQMARGGAVKVLKPDAGGLSNILKPWQSLGWALLDFFLFGRGNWDREWVPKQGQHPNHFENTDY
jgi:hypothetical protein